MTEKKTKTVTEIVKGVIVLSLVAVVGLIIYITKNPWWFFGLLLPAFLAEEFWD